MSSVFLANWNIKTLACVVSQSATSLVCRWVWKTQPEPGPRAGTVRQLKITSRLLWTHAVFSDIYLANEPWLSPSKWRRRTGVWSWTWWTASSESVCSPCPSASNRWAIYQGTAMMRLEAPRGRLHNTFATWNSRNGLSVLQITLIDSFIQVFYTGVKGNTNWKLFRVGFLEFCFLIFLHLNNFSLGFSMSNKVFKKWKYLFSLKVVHASFCAAAYKF